MTYARGKLISLNDCLLYVQSDTIQSLIEKLNSKTLDPTNQNELIARNHLMFMNVLRASNLINATVRCEECRMG